MEEKTMKKIFAYSFAAVFAVFAVSCQSENLDPQTVTDEQNQPVQLITETITATVDEGNTKATVATSDGTFNWTGGTDKIAVHTTSGYVNSGAASATGNSASFSVTYSGSRDAFAVYPYTLVYDEANDEYYSNSVSDYGQNEHSLIVNLPATYALSAVSGENTPCPMIADNTGSGWEFKQLCGLLRLTVSDIPSGTSYLKLDFNGRKVSGAFSVASPVTAGISTIASVAGTKGTDDFIKITGITTETSVTVNIPLPTGTAYSDLIVSAWNSSDVPLKAQVTPFSYTASRAKGKKLTSALSLGVFSIVSGKYAVIAPGNLQYQASTSTWRFAEHQYDYVGDGSNGNVYVGETKSNNASVSSDYTGWIDLFGWGTSGSAPSDQTARAPYYTTQNNSDYVSNITTDGESWGENSEWDWGHNAISNGGNTADTWRTLTKDEWVYLINVDNSGSYRQVTVGSDKKAPYGHASVNGVNGLVLLPDGWDGSVHSGFTYGKSSWSNVYTESSTPKWSEMESAGCVFLPAAGYRLGTGVYSVGDGGGYWSSTASNADYAYGLNFFSSNVNPAFSNYRCYGYSVRLVQNLN